MEAARRLVQRGNKVVLFEKDAQLGGSLIPAGANSLKGDVKRYTQWSVRMTQRLEGLDLRLGTEATRQMVLAEKPDAVIVAVGSEPLVPNIPGIHGCNVSLAIDVDMGKVQVGHKVVLIGAGLTGTETATVLAQEGHDVTVIDMLSLDEIDSRGGTSRSVSAMLRSMSQQAGVKVMTGLRCSEITENSVVAVDSNGSVLTLECDSVVLSMGVRPRKETVSEFDGTAYDVFYVGDCAARAGNITSAVRDGFYAAMNI